MSFYKRLGRNQAQRKALFRDLITDLIINNQIVTTEAKAKELKVIADKMVTLAKKQTLASRRQAAEFIRFERNEKDRTALEILFTDLYKRFKKRNGGYTRVLKMQPRQGDSAPMALLMYVE